MAGAVGFAGVLAWQGGGAIGSGGLATVGASPWQAGLATGGGAGAVAVVGLGLVALAGVVRFRAEEDDADETPVRLVSTSARADETTDGSGAGRKAGKVRPVRIVVLASGNLGLVYLFSQNVPGANEKQAIEKAIEAFERYKKLAPRSGRGAGDDVDELLARARNKKAIIEALESMPPDNASPTPSNAGQTGGAG